MTVMQPTANLAKITIPTGYEQQQIAAASKRRLADAMLQQGLAPDPNMTSWTQVLGHLAQDWAGKSMQKDADKIDAAVRGKILSDYNNKRAAFLADSHILNPGQLVQKYGGDPFLAQDLKPYEDAFAAGLKQNEELANFGGRMVRKGDVVGQYANDPNKMVFVDPDGQTSLNPVAVTAAGIATGNLTPTGGYQSVGHMPGTQRLVEAMTGQSQPHQTISLTNDQGGSILDKASHENVISGTDAAHVWQSMGPNGQAAFSKWLQDNNIKIHVSTPQEAQQLPSGTVITLPDGTEGRVP